MGITKTQSYKKTWAWAWARESWMGKSVRACRGYSYESRAWVRNSWMGESVRACRRYGRELWTWRRTEETRIPHVHQLAASISALHMVAPEAVDGEKDTEAPIFLLSNGMRAGSTLLQRILVTDPHLLLWGEPFGAMDLVSGIAERVARPVNPWNMESSEKLNPNSSSLATSWIADMYPPGENFRLALRGFFDRWLREPARQLGFARWGFKEIRLGATEATFLRWLYPRAKFLILSRHPYDCYRSLADSGWVAPIVDDVEIDSAAAFARLWNRLVLSWSELPAEFPAFHIKYEDLISGKVDFRKLESWLGLEIKESVALSAIVGGTAKRPSLSRLERLIIAREAAAGMQSLGYSDNSGNRSPNRVSDCAAAEQFKTAPAGLDPQ
jgi:Sulfotransferase family